MRFKDKNVLITGAGSGIGEAMSREFAAEGAFVWVVDRDQEAGTAVAKDIGGEFLACDVSNQEEVNALIDNVTKEKQLHVLVNNAGISHIGTVETTTGDDMDRVYNVNVKGVYNFLHAVLPKMVESGGGVVLNMASIASKVGLKDRFAYSMSKGAVFTMTLSVAHDYIEHGIRCNCICPARVHTPFVDNYLAKNYPGEEEKMFATLSAAQPIGRMAKPAEIGKLATYLCSDDAGFVTGGAWDIDGGVMNLR
ncbi:MAG: SDR family oxidoreductase [Verrucomicrobiota bacterium]